MKVNIFKRLKFLMPVIGLVSLLASCNKDLPEATPITQPAPTGATILETLNDPSYSFLKAAVTRASSVPSPTGSLTALLGDKSGVYTFFALDDNAFKASLSFLGLPPDITSINFFRPGELDTLIKYHLIGGQEFTAAKVNPVAPSLNLYLQSSFVLSAPSPTLPPGYRMPVFLGKQGNFVFANNIPVTQADIDVANGVIHKIALALLPPGLPLIARIASDADLTYLYAAIKKADEGDPAQTLQAALSNPAANLTVFAPTNAAFQQLLTGLITQALIGQGMDPATAAATATALASTPGVFTHPALASVLTPTTVKGIVVYHLLGNRAFSVNLPPTTTNVPTLLNGAVPAHPGVGVQGTLGAMGVTAASVKGAVNPTASNILINPTPAPNGSSDQLYINGILHKIDQVLLPQQP